MVREAIQIKPSVSDMVRVAIQIKYSVSDMVRVPFKSNLRSHIWLEWPFETEDLI